MLQRLIQAVLSMALFVFMTHAVFLHRHSSLCHGQGFFRPLSANSDNALLCQRWDMKSLRVLFFAAICLLLFLPCNVSANKVTPEKVPTLLFNLLISDDSVSFAKQHNIEVKDGSIRVVVTVAPDFSKKIFIDKYGPTEYQKRKNIVIIYIAIDNLRQLKKEDYVIFIRFPHTVHPM